MQHAHHPLQDDLNHLRKLLALHLNLEQQLLRMLDLKAYNCETLRGMVAFSLNNSRFDICPPAIDALILVSAVKVCHKLVYLVGFVFFLGYWM